ncbi:hypothetical protein K402DRAFT_404272 [Aulographum hederae CBS 113979]|uniref:Uncharacterized protein n=1 Tax=Aulographum hederae CBS 113979 TaxID=1176131 RepID=A0A6G1H037_9PEZI|nr:hypothetical protein K402DRAFT_404272 [Aulographum hederae CBS 113979]
MESRPKFENMQLDVVEVTREQSGNFFTRLWRRDYAPTPIDEDAYQTRRWKPHSLRIPFLVGIIVISLGLLAALQVLLTRSQKDGGLLFASRINDLPIGQTFAYLYLPTVIAVSYSFLWTWIDLDAKRLEPYYQLSKDGGAAGSQSLLLHYPVDFIASVPIKAFRLRHWSVFYASAAMVLIFWGLTPTQAGIFATETIVRTEPMSMLKSTSYIPVAQQEKSVPATYAQSASNIIWFNESLPAFMTKQSMLAPFGPVSDPQTVETRETWSGQTRMYSLDVSCEDAKLNETGTESLTSTWGCKFQRLHPRTLPNNDSSKVFDTLYVGYFNDDGMADFYLDNGGCPENETSSFLVQWSKVRVPMSEYAEQEDQFANASLSTVYCRPSYFYQDVNATISLPSRGVVDVQPVGPKVSLPADIFNGSNFEESINVGHQRFAVRGDYPTFNWPNDRAHLQDLPLNLEYFRPLTSFAVGGYQGPLDDFLDGENIRKSYEAAYRLLFARQMVDVLGSELDPSSLSEGVRTFTTQAVVLVPVFTYVVEAFLVVVAVLTCSLLYISCASPNKLSSDPATTTALMKMVADQDDLLEAFRDTDQMSEKELEKKFKDDRFHLDEKGNIVGGSESGLPRSLSLPTGHHLQHRSSSTEQLLPRRTRSASAQVKGVQPAEFGLSVGMVFLAFQIAFVVALAVLLWKAKTMNGLPLPSQNQFVRQLVENYIPIALATFIEPFWLVLNRLLCMLQPFEELRRGNAPAAKSISLDYASLPPQFNIWRSLCSGHFLLAAVCAMTILANLLAVAFGAMFFEDSVPTSSSAVFAQDFPSLADALGEPPVPANASYMLSSTALFHPFYRAMSNMTAHTPMAPWTDDQYFYLPFSPPEVREAPSGNLTLRAATSAMGVEMGCSQVLSAGKDTYSLSIAKDGRLANLTVTLAQGDQQVKCKAQLFRTDGFSDYSAGGVPMITGSSLGPSAFEFARSLQAASNRSPADSDFCRQHFAAGWVRANLAAAGEKDGLYGPVPISVSSHQETVIVCRPSILAGPADIVVDTRGFLVETMSANISQPLSGNHLVMSPENLTTQAHTILLDNAVNWHNDSFSSDFNNYLIEKILNTSRLLDPKLPPPDADLAIKGFEAVYKKLFATLIGTHFERIILPFPISPETAATILPSTRANATALTNTNNKNVLHGTSITPTTRIFLSVPMFIIAQSILLLYILTTIALYARRPWRMLPRLPTCPASVVGFFAAGRAVRGFKRSGGRAGGNAGWEKRGEERFAYGGFVGVDGGAYVGIEKAEFVGEVVGRDGDGGGEWLRGLRWRGGGRG